jgi:hypothetical protein
VPDLRPFQPHADYGLPRSGILKPWLLILLIGLSIRIVLLWQFPALYGGDTVLHLRNHDRILLSHQLPLLQVLIFAFFKITTAPIALRLVMVVLGAISAVGFYLLCLCLFSREVAFWIALFAISNPFLNEISLVPFQEIILLGALCFSVAFYLNKQTAAASIAFGLACLTRYEAWIAAPILLMDYWAGSGWKKKQLLVGCGLFLWAPALWIGCHLGLSSQGSYVLEFPRSAARIVRWIYLGWITVKDTPVPVLAVAAIGIVVLCKKHLLRQRGVVLFSGFGILFLCAILFSAHGIPHSIAAADSERFVTSREATVLVAYTLLLAGVGLESLMRTSRWRGLAVFIGLAGVALGLVQSAFFLAKETSEPEVALSYRLARYLDLHVGPGEKVLILAKPFEQADLSPSLEKARELGGEEGLAAARRMLNQVDLSPISFQRTAVQMSLPQRQILAAGNPAGAQWIAAWSDSPQWEEITRQLQTFPLAREMHAGKLQIRIWKVPTKAFSRRDAITGGACCS